MARKVKVPASTWASDVRAILDAFQLAEKDQVIPYHELSALIGKPVTGASSEYQHAKERAARDYGIQITTIRGKGPRRDTDGGIVEQLPGDRESIHRKIKKSLRKANNVEDPSTLTNTQKLEHARHLAHLGLMRQLREPQVARAIDTRVTRGLSAPEVATLLEVLRS